MRLFLGIFNHCDLLLFHYSVISNKKYWRKLHLSSAFFFHLHSLQKIWKFLKRGFWKANICLLFVVTLLYSTEKQVSDTFRCTLQTWDLRKKKRHWLIKEGRKLTWKKNERIWKSQKIKVSFNIASEASYVYILSGQKLIKNTKNCPIWRAFEKLKLMVKQCYQTGQF